MMLDRVCNILMAKERDLIAGIAIVLVALFLFKVVFTDMDTGKYFENVLGFLFGLLNVGAYYFERTIYMGVVLSPVEKPDQQGTRVLFMVLAFIIMIVALIRM